MTTQIRTNEVQVLKRTWSDLDPKVRNALDVWVLTVLLAIAGIATKSLSPVDALCLLIPVTVAVVTAYATTSKHKELVFEVAKGAAAVANVALPPIYRGPVAAALNDVEEATQSDPPEDPHPLPETPDIAPTQVIPSVASQFLANLHSSTAPVADGH